MIVSVDVLSLNWCLVTVDFADVQVATEFWLKRLSAIELYNDMQSFERVYGFDNMYELASFLEFGGE